MSHGLQQVATFQVKLFASSTLEGFFGFFLFFIREFCIDLIQSSNDDGILNQSRFIVFFYLK